MHMCPAIDLLNTYSKIYRTEGGNSSAPQLEDFDNPFSADDRGKNHQAKEDLRNSLVLGLSTFMVVAHIQSMVREIRSHKLHSAAKKKKKNEREREKDDLNKTMGSLYQIALCKALHPSATNEAG